MFWTALQRRTPAAEVVHFWRPNKRHQFLLKFNEQSVKLRSLEVPFKTSYVLESWQHFSATNTCSYADSRDQPISPNHDSQPCFYYVVKEPYSRHH